MRKWLWIGALSVALSGAGGYWYLSTKTIVDVGPRPFVGPVASNGRNDGDAEASDVVEPLIVDRGNTFGVQSPEPPVDDGPMSRVVLEPGMKQPPRPDAEQGRVPRMPYADEEEILGLTGNPVKRILESNLAPLNIFEELEKANPAEESETTEVAPPILPVPDYHHNHCPYHGGCPAPYYPRSMPR
jgi:hypothetical protein